MMCPASYTVVYSNINKMHHFAHYVCSYLCHFSPVLFDQVQQSTTPEQYGGPTAGKVMQCEQRMSYLLQIKS